MQSTDGMLSVICLYIASVFGTMVVKFCDIKLHDGLHVICLCRF